MGPPHQVGSASAFILSLLFVLVFQANNPQAAFDTLKGLQGKWAIQSEGKTLAISMSYEVGSKGSIVTEQFGKELSVFYRDGQGLVMIHFCNAGNQPRLRLRENGPSGVLEFETFEITNLKAPDTSHVQRVIYRLIDPNTVDLEIVWQQGKSQSSEKYHLFRNKERRQEF